MANEITVTVSGGITNGYFVDTIPSQTLKINQSALGGELGVRSVATSAAAIPLGSVSTPGVAYFKNLDPTNYVDVGVYVSGTFYPLIRLAPAGSGNSAGEVAIFRFTPTSTPYWQANTAACLVQMKIYQN